MTTYSHSRISTFEQCKYKYKLQYVDKIRIEVPTTIEQFMGQIVHTTMEKLYIDLRFGITPTLQILITLFDQRWDKEYSDKIINPRGYPATTYKDMGKRFITDYYNTYAPFKDSRTIDLETEHKLTLSNGHSYHIRIDRLACDDEGNYYVVDYKTNATLKTQMEADDDRQLAMYSIWVNAAFPDSKKVELVWHMLAFNKRVVSSRTPQQLAALQKEVEMMIEAIETCDDFPTSASRLCDWCQYKSMCPSFRHQTQATMKGFDKDDGSKLVDEYTRLKNAITKAQTQLDSIEESLVAFAKEQGIDVVYGSDQKISIKEYEKITITDKEGLITFLKEKGLYEKFIQLSTMKIQASVKNKELDAEQFVSHEKGIRISVRSKKEEDNA